MSHLKEKLKEECWDPQSCGCKFQMYLEETVKESDVLSDDTSTPLRGKEKYLRVGQEIKRVSPVYVTTTTNEAGEKESSVKHPPGVHPPPGSRLRARIVSPCPGHAGFTGALQTQRYRNPDVCKCIVREIWKGDRKKEVFFGHYMERVCEGHINMPAKQVRGDIITKGRELNAARIAAEESSGGE